MFNYSSQQGYSGDVLSRAVGKPLAKPIRMILVTMRMKVLSGKRRVLSQTIAALSGFIRMERGCRRCELYRSVEDENRLCLLEEWDPRKSLINHLKSDHYKVFRGAMNLLAEPCEKTFHTVFEPKGMEGL